MIPYIVEEKVMSEPKLAIAHREGSFSTYWIDYCQKKNIAFKVVDPYATDIIDQVRNYDGFLWHWSHQGIPHLLFARQLTYSLESMGIRVFPNTKTSWHFDDKIGQKYLFESHGFPLVPTYVFYDRKTANQWIETTDFPKVFKLRGGAGSSNVELVRNSRQAKYLVRKAFGRGFPTFKRCKTFRENIVKAVLHPNKKNLKATARSLYHLFVPSEFEKVHGGERGYIYFQDFCDNNTYDTRVTVIGDRAFAFRRFVRDNDFRASGSGKINYTASEIDTRCIQIAFKIVKQLGLQSCAFDFMSDTENRPVIGEISYGYDHSAVAACPGYWDSQLHWHDGSYLPSHLILDDLLAQLKPS